MKKKKTQNSLIYEEWLPQPKILPVVMISIVVAYVHLPATRCAPSFPMYLKGCIVYDVTFHSYLPERFVELVNGNSALVETSPRHNCIVAPKSALLRQAREMVVKAHIIFNKWLKVIPKKTGESAAHVL